MRNVAAVNSDESTILILCTLEWSLTQFVLQCDQWFHDGLKFLFHYLFHSERMFSWALYPTLCSFLFALYLEWSLNTNFHKKCSLYTRQFFKDVICIFRCYSVQPNCRGQYQFIGKVETHLSYFHLLTLSLLKWRFLYIPPTLFFLATPLPATHSTFIQSHFLLEK